MEEPERAANAGATQEVHKKANRLIATVTNWHERAAQLRALYLDAWEKSDVAVDPAHLQHLFYGPGPDMRSVISTLGAGPLNRLKEAAQNASLGANSTHNETLLLLLGPDGFSRKVSGHPPGSNIEAQLSALFLAGHGTIALRLARQRGQLDSMVAVTRYGRSDIGFTVPELIQTVMQSTRRGQDQQSLASSAVKHAFFALGPESAREVFTTLTTTAGESIARGALDAAKECETLVTLEDISRLKPVLQDYWSHLTDRESYPTHSAPAPGAINRLVGTTSLVELEIEPETFSPSEMKRLRERRFALKRVAQWIRDIPSPLGPLRQDLAQVLERYGAGAHIRTLTQEDDVLGYNAHVLRLLHMRTLLEHEPPKWRGVDLPYLMAIEAFILDVAPYVRYAPRLTLGTQEMKQSLLRRQSEELGETFAICLLEDSVGFNLATLVRPAETPKSKVADFEFVYDRTRRALLECKGRTVWAGFLSARKEAIRQIEAMLEARKNARGQCRAFVSRLFIATPGATQQSLLSILDPPAGFSEFVAPEELDDMTRRHAYAEAQMAGLQQLATTLQSRDPSTSSIAAARQELENRRVRSLGIGALVGTEREISLPEERGAESSVRAKIIGAIEETRAKMMLERSWEALRNAAQPPQEQPAHDEMPFAPGIAQLSEGEGIYSAAADGSVLAVVRS